MYNLIVPLLYLLSLSAHFSSYNAQPTTPHLQEIFYGKCLEKNPASTDCEQLWDAFAHGAKMDMTRVSDVDFAEFFEIADFSAAIDNALFWSGNKGFANRLSADGTRFTTLEETSTGYILNGLSWCGKAYENGTAPSFDYVNSCVYRQNDTYYGSQGVWNKCSQHFAASAKGKINVMLQPQQLDYNSGPYLAYRNTSIFWAIELPSMNTTAVTEIHILLLANQTRAPEEMCGSGSLLQLSDDVFKKFGYRPTCVDDPDHIIGILCDNGQENTPECMAAYMTSHEQKQNAAQRGLLAWAIAGTCFASILGLAVVVLAYNVISMKKKLHYVSISDSSSPEYRFGASYQAYTK